MFRKNKVDTKWSSSLAYAIGIITTDGNLSIDGRHLSITSKDEEIPIKLKFCLNLDNKIGKKARGHSTEKKYHVLQFGDKNFYNFLLKLGLMPAKSKILGSLKIPSKFFPDFLRGCIDGDGNIIIARHPESKHGQLRIRLATASIVFAIWMMDEIRKKIKCKGGWIYCDKRKNVYSICFGKEDSVKILKYMYYDKVKYYLDRKYKLARMFIGRVA